MRKLSAAVASVALGVGISLTLKATPLACGLIVSGIWAALYALMPEDN